MHMGEEGQKAQHGDDLELQLVTPVRNPFGQGVQTKEQDTDRQNGNEQKHGHSHHEDVGLAGGGNERWQMVGSCRVRRRTHTAPPMRTDAYRLHRNADVRRSVLQNRITLSSVGVLDLILINLPNGWWALLHQRDGLKKTEVSKM